MQERSKRSAQEQSSSSAATSAPVLTSVERKIARRWDQMKPWARIAGLELESARQSHREWCISLIRRGVDWRKLKSLSLDDPRLSVEERNEFANNCRA